MSYSVIGKDDAGEPVFCTDVEFQNGMPSEVGVNGIGMEALFAINIDRLRGFQYARLEDGTFDYNTPGKYACESNALALSHTEAALEALHSRTRARVERKVEGTPAV